MDISMDISIYGSVSLIAVSGVSRKKFQPKQSKSITNDNNNPTWPSRSRAEPGRGQPGPEPSRACRPEPTEQSRAEAEACRPEPNRAGPGRAEPSQAGPGRAKPSRTEPGRAEPSRAWPYGRGCGCYSELFFFRGGLFFISFYKEFTICL